MTAELIAGTLHPAPGSTILVGFRMSPQPGWHGYWSNPGDSGIAPSVRWAAPKGVSFGPLLHPAPTLLTANGISSFVHEGQHMILARMTIARSIAAGTSIPIAADLSWAACTATQCVPLHAQFSLQLTAGDGERTSDWPAIRSTLAKLPRAAPEGTFARAGKTLRLEMPSALKLDPRTARFFPHNGTAFDTEAARSSRVDGRTVISAPASGSRPASLSGVVTDGHASYRLTLHRAQEAPSEEIAEEPKPLADTPKPAETTTITPDKPPAALPAKQPAEASWLWAVVASAVGIGAAAFAFGRRRS